MKMNPVVHFEMPYEDHGRVEKFYADAFGWKMEKMGKDMGDYVVATTSETDEKRMVKKPGTINGGFYPKAGAPEAKCPSVVIAVDDIKEAIRKIKESGGKLLGEPTDIPNIGRYVSFSDSEGNRVSILQPRKMKTDPSPENDKTGLTISRVFDAPREKVWEAWTNPEMIKKWWGPKGFSAPAAKADLHEGGKYLYAMRGKPGPDKPEQDFWSGGVFQEIVPEEKIVVTDYFTDKKGNRVPASHYGMTPDFPMEMTVIVTFEDAGENKTKFTLRYPSRGNMPAADREGMNEGWNQSLDKLAEALK